MSDKFIENYARYFSICRSLGQTNLSSRSVLALSKLVARWVHPDRHDFELWKAAWSGSATLQTWWRVAWLRYLSTGLFATATLYRIRQWHELLPVTIVDPDLRVEEHRRRGGFIIPFHQHFAYHIGILLGMRGLSICPITLDPGVGAFADLAEEFGRVWFADSEGFLGDGHWIFTGGNNAGAMREIKREFDRGRIIFSAIDIQNFYKNAPTVSGVIAGIKYEIPITLVRLALVGRRPISFASASIAPGGGLVIHIQPANDFEGEEGVIYSYLGLLNSILSHRPEFWEGWRGLIDRANFQAAGEHS